MCVQEAIAWVQGQPHSDHPVCVSPTIGGFLRSWNDSLPDDATRTRLLVPLMADVVNTAPAPPEIERARGWLCFDWLIRVYTPAWLDLMPALAKHATALRALPVLHAGLTEAEQAALTAEARAAYGVADGAVRGVAYAAVPGVAYGAVRDVADDAANDAARDAAYDAARGAAYDAAYAAACAAACDAAYDAAYGAARGAAYDAAYDAAYAAACAAACDAAHDAADGAADDAARGAAYDAARGAARAAAGGAAYGALKPTMDTLQISAQDLVRQMAALFHVSGADSTLRIPPRGTEER
jgi:hypothetical protein